MPRPELSTWVKELAYMVTVLWSLCTENAGTPGFHIPETRTEGKATEQQWLFFPDREGLGAVRPLMIGLV